MLLDESQMSRELCVSDWPEYFHLSPLPAPRQLHAACKVQPDESLLLSPEELTWAASIGQ